MLKEYKVYEADRRLVRVVIANSTKVGIGYPVSVRGGITNVPTAARGGGIGGVVVALEDGAGNSVFGSLASLGGATKTGTPDSGSVTTGAANNGTDNITAVIDCSKTTIFSAQVTGTMGTTASSNTLGGWIDLDAANNDGRVDETTHTRTIATGGQLKTWGVDPTDSTRMLVSINCSEFWDPAVTLS